MEAKHNQVAEYLHHHNHVLETESQGGIPAGVLCVYVGFVSVYGPGSHAPVFLLHIAPDGDVLGADLAAVAQQRPGTGVQPALVGHVRVDETLGADKLQARGRGHRHRLTVTGRQNLTKHRPNSQET